MVYSFFTQTMRQDGTVRASRMVDTNPAAGPGFRSKKKLDALKQQQKNKLSRFPTAGESYRAGQVKRPVMHCNRTTTKKKATSHHVGVLANKQLKFFFLYLDCRNGDQDREFS